MDPTTAAISFNVAADNLLGDLIINGTSTGISSLNGFGSFDAKTLGATEIALLNGGTNTFTFRVDTNSGGGVQTDYFGLQVEFTTKTADTVPEPSSLALLGLGSLLGLRRRRA